MVDLKRCYRVYALVLSACSSFSLAAHDNTLSEKDLLDEIPMVSIASRLDQPVNLAPASVTIIDRDLIDASGAQNWGDLFRLVPGFQSYAVNDNRPGIAYHGFGEQFPNRLEVMIDGRSVYEPVFSTVIWGTLGIQLEDETLRIDKDRCWSNESGELVRTGPVRRPPEKTFQSSEPRLKFTLREMTKGGTSRRKCNLRSITEMNPPKRV